MDIIRSTQFKRDFKKIKNSPQKIELFSRALLLLLNRKPLPKTYDEHSLKGNKQGFVDIHLFPDFLLIYRIDLLKSEINLARIGIHSELFK